VYRRSDDGGKTWTAPVLFGLADDAVQQTTLALTSEGNPFVVYRSVKGGRLYAQRSPDQGANWDAPTEIPGVQALDTAGRGLDIYSMATDGADHIHLAMVGYRDGENRVQTPPTLMHLTWDGRGWSAPETIMQRAGYLPEWPRLVVAGGTELHVVWFTRHDLETQTADEDPRFYQVWYSTQTVTAPASTALPIFTPTPERMPTPTEPAITPTPIPTLAPMIAQAPPISSRPAGESSGMITIGVALLPLIGMLAMLWAWTRRAQGRRH
jgi:hypothetical protein